VIVDLQVNGTHDDGSPCDPTQVLALANVGWLDGVVVVGEGGLPDVAAYTAARGEDDPLVFFGALVTTDRARFVCIPKRLDDTGFLPPSARAAGRLPSQELLRHVGAREGAVIVCQPFDRDSGPAPGDLVFALDGIHAVQTRTASASALAVDMAIEAALAMHLPCVAGTGAAATDRWQQRYATLLLDEVATQAELVAAIKTGDLWSVQLERTVAQSESVSNGRRSRRSRRGRKASATAD